MESSEKKEPPVKSVIYYEPDLDIQEVLKLGVSDIILSTTFFSRFGKLSRKQLNEALALLNDVEINVIFEWDLLLTNEDFKRCCLEFESLDLDRVDFFRALDPGVFSYLVSRNHKVHLLLDSGPFHNLQAIQSFLELGEGLVKRIVLSIELDQEELSVICDELDVEIEYLGYGQILLFYTPRSLVKPLYDAESTDNWLEVTANSEESPHKGFPVIENIHGTFMFNPKDHYVLEHVSSLDSLGVSHIKLDNRFFKNSLLASLLCEPEQAKNDLPRKTIRGFFHKNKSDALFKKLKNHRILRRDKNYIGQVIEVEKGECVGIYLRNTLEHAKDMNLTLITPEGKEKSVVVNDVRDANGSLFKSGKYGDIIFIPHVGGVSVKTNVYYDG